MADIFAGNSFEFIYLTQKFDILIQIWTGARPLSEQMSIQFTDLYIFDIMGPFY